MVLVISALHDATGKHRQTRGTDLLPRTAATSVLCHAAGCEWVQGCRPGVAVVVTAAASASLVRDVD